MGRMDKLKPRPFCGNVEPLVSVADLPADKQAGARRGLAALLDGMKGQIGDGEDE